VTRGSRNGKDLSVLCPELSTLGPELQRRVILDGELVASRTALPTTSASLNVISLSRRGARRLRGWVRKQPVPHSLPDHVQRGTVQDELPE
jgi:hypothetical protein